MDATLRIFAVTAFALCISALAGVSHVGIMRVFAILQPDLILLLGLGAALIRLGSISEHPTHQA